VQIADVGGGSCGAIIGILTAVIHRQQTGAGQQIDISMFDFSIAWNSLAASHYLISGHDPEPEGNWLNGGSYYDFYRTADGRYLSVGSLEPKFWTGFCQAIGRPDLIEPGYNPTPEGQSSLKAEIKKAIAARTLDEWTAIFSQIDVCVEPVLTVSEMLQHPQTQARQMVVDVPKPDGAPQKQIGSPFKFSQGGPSYRHTGASLGAHTEEILTEIGYSAQEIQALRAAEVLGKAG